MIAMEEDKGLPINTWLEILIVMSSIMLCSVKDGDLYNMFCPETSTKSISFW